jgi:hypothetical protein
VVSWTVKTLEDLAKAKNVDLSVAPAQFASLDRRFLKSQTNAQAHQVSLHRRVILGSFEKLF